MPVSLKSLAFLAVLNICLSNTQSVSTARNASIPAQTNTFLDILRNLTEQLGKDLPDYKDNGIFNTSGLLEFFNGFLSGQGQESSQGFQFQDLLLRIVLPADVGPHCIHQLAVMSVGLAHQLPWALKMLDAIGKPESEILEGHLRWLGSYDECLRVKAVTYSNYTTLADPVHHFKGQYCSLKLPLPPALAASSGLPFALQAVVTLGVCVPDACRENDVAEIVTAVYQIIQNGTTDPEPEVQCQVDDLPMSTEAMFAIILLSIVGTLVFLGTLYDILVIQMSLSVTKTSAADNTNSPDKTNVATCSASQAGQPSQEPTEKSLDKSTKLEESEGITPDDSMKDHQTDLEKGKAEMVTPVTVVETPPAVRGPLENALLAFSVYTNAVKVMNTRQAAGSLGSVNGIRFLSISWVILGHSYYVAYIASDNLVPFMSRKMEQWTFMAVPYATFAVDSFFALSGLLVAYLTLRELKKLGGIGRFNWGMYYFHRFWRLTPPYMLVLMIYVTLLRYFSSGPMWDQSEDREILTYCRKHWWTNLLYVQNLVEPKEMCMSWSWYLANDMQFYVLSPILLIPLFYNKIFGGAVSLVFLAATTVTPALIAEEHKYPAQLFNRYTPKPKDPDYSETLYFPPYGRMGPYIVGIVTGYLLYKMRCKCRMPKIIMFLGWFLAAGIMTSAVYGLYDKAGQHTFSNNESALYHGASRTGWGIAVYWVVFACATDNGGVVNQFLSWKAFVPLARLSYGAYLVHPIVMTSYYQSRRQLVYFTDYETIHMFVSNLVISFGAAFIVSLAFESPMMGLEKVIFKRDRRS